MFWKVNVSFIENMLPAKNEGTLKRLLQKGSQLATGKPTGAGNIAAPLDIE